MGNWEKDFESLFGEVDRKDYIKAFIQDTLDSGVKEVVEEIIEKYGDIYFDPSWEDASLRMALEVDHLKKSIKESEK